MQKRLVRKLDLERALSEIEPHPTPKAYLEQYTIPPEVAAEILFTATYVHDDVTNKTVVDLGCGTGRLAIGAALLGARETFGVDLDKVAIKAAQKNAERMKVKERTHWIVADIDAIRGAFDTVLQNPPFGVQRRKADRKFIKKSLELGRRIYSLHKASESSRELIKRLRGRGARFIPVPASPFLRRFIEKHGGEIKAVYAMPMTIPYMFEFHRKRKHEFVVNLYIIERRKGKIK
jgi:putative methylase